MLLYRVLRMVVFLYFLIAAETKRKRKGEKAHKYVKAHKYKSPTNVSVPLKKNKVVKPWVLFRNITKELKHLSADLKGVQDIAMKRLYSLREQAGVRVHYPRRHPLLCVSLLQTSEAVFQLQYRSIVASKASCHWALVGYKGSNDTLQDFRLTLEKANVTVIMSVMHIDAHEHHCDFVTKPRLYPHLLPYLAMYQWVWFLDEDLSLSSFDVPCFLKTVSKEASLPKKPLLLVQPTLRENTQATKAFAREFWFKKDSDDPIYPNVILGVHWYIEQQMPMFDADFFQWYIEFVILPLKRPREVLCNDWGVESSWCMAAFHYAKIVLNYNDTGYFPCGVVVGKNLSVQHFNTRSIKMRRMNRNLFAELGKESIALHNKIFPVFNNDNARVNWIFKTRRSDKFKKPVFIYNASFS